MPRGVYSIPGRRKAWTPDDDMTLDDLAAQGLSMPQIARRMGRSVNSVDVRSGGRIRGLRPMSARQVAALLGIGCSKTVSRWIAEGWLRGRKLAVGAGAARRWGVSEGRPAHIPGGRPRHRNWYTSAEDRTLVALRDAGHPPDRIAAAVGRPIGSVRKRLWTLSRS